VVEGAFRMPVSYRNGPPMIRGRIVVLKTWNLHRFGFLALAREQSTQTWPRDNSTELSIILNGISSPLMARPIFKAISRVMILPLAWLSRKAQRNRPLSLTGAYVDGTIGSFVKALWVYHPTECRMLVDAKSVSDPAPIAEYLPDTVWTLRSLL